MKYDIFTKKKTLIIVIFTICIFLTQFTPILFNQTNSKLDESITSIIETEEPSSANLQTEYYHINIDDLTMVNNYPALESLQNKYLSANLLMDRPDSLYYTYFLYEAIHKLDPNIYQNQLVALNSYIMSKYNPISKHFEEPINYSLFQEDGELLFRYPYSPCITHQLALILLSKIGCLTTNFDQAQIQTWEEEILANLNVDGGFGVKFIDHSTIFETYYSVLATKALNNNDITSISAYFRAGIVSFIESRQKLIPGLTVYAFYEYDAGIKGWQHYYTSWLALQTIAEVGGSFENVKDKYIDFITTGVLTPLYNPIANCYYSELNDRMDPQIATFFGTAIIADTIQLLNIENCFPELEESLIVLLNSTYRNQSNQHNNVNFFMYRNDSFGNSDDLFYQALVLKTLSDFNLIVELEDENNNFDSILEYLRTFLNSNGGGCYISSLDPPSIQKYVYYSFLSREVSSEDLESLYQDILSRFRYSASNNIAYFGDHLNISSSINTAAEKIICIWKEWEYYPIATNYFSISLLDQFDLLTFFSLNLYEYMETGNWIKNQLLPSGKFRNYELDATSGNIESTYYALKSHNILINNNRGDSLSNYYSTENKSMILDYVNQFLVVTSTEIYCNQGLDENIGINKFKMFQYCLEINNILEEEIISVKIQNYLYNALENYFQLSVEEKISLLQLCDEYHIDLSVKDLLPLHIQTATLIQDLNKSIRINKPKIEYLTILLTFENQTAIFMDYPENQFIGESYTYTVKFANIFSQIFPDEINLEGINTSFDNWYKIGFTYACEISPEVNETDPSIWCPSFRFEFNNLEFLSEEISIFLLYDFEYTWSFFLDENNRSLVTMIINSPSSICNSLLPFFEIYLEEIQIISIDSSSLNILFLKEYSTNQVVYTFFLDEILPQSGECFINPQFENQWVIVDSFIFQYVQFTPITTTTSSTINTTTNTTTSTNTTTATSSTANTTITTYTTTTSENETNSPPTSTTTYFENTSLNSISTFATETNSTSGTNDSEFSENQSSTRLGIKFNEYSIYYLAISGPCLGISIFLKRKKGKML